MTTGFLAAQRTFPVRPFLSLSPSSPSSPSSLFSSLLFSHAATTPSPSLLLNSHLILMFFRHFSTLGLTVKFRSFPFCPFLFISAPRSKLNFQLDSTPPPFFKSRNSQPGCPALFLQHPPSCSHSCYTLKSGSSWLLKEMVQLTSVERETDDKRSSDRKRVNTLTGSPTLDGQQHSSSLCFKMPFCLTVFPQMSTCVQIHLSFLELCLDCTSQITFVHSAAPSGFQHSLGFCRGRSFLTLFTHSGHH